MGIFIAFHYIVSKIICQYIPYKYMSKISNILKAFTVYIGVHLGEIIRSSNNIGFTQPLRLSICKPRVLQKKLYIVMLSKFFTKPKYS